MFNNNPAPKLNFDKDEAIYHWSSFPFVDRPRQSVFLCIVIAITAYILYQLAIVMWDQPLYYILGIIILCIALAPYFVSTSYYFFETGFLVQYPFIKVEKLYKDYGCFYADKMGIMLSTYQKPRRMDTFRGQSIRFSKTGEEREKIIELLSEKIGRKF